MKKYMYIMFVLGLALLSVACRKQEKKEDVEDEKLKIEETEDKSSVTTYVESEKVAGEIKEVVNKIFVDKEYENYTIVNQKALVDKNDNKKIIELQLFMKIDNPNKEEAEALADKSAVLIKDAIEKKYTYEKLELYWETPSHPQEDMKEIMYIN